MTENENGLKIVNMNKIFEEIAEERKRQHELWGQQNFPMLRTGLYHPSEHELSPSKRGLISGLKYVKERQKTEKICWYDILFEEAFEAFLETEPKRQREEMIQVAAVAVQIIEYLDRRKTNGIGV